MAQKHAQDAQDEADRLYDLHHVLPRTPTPEPATGLTYSNPFCPSGLIYDPEAKKSFWQDERPKDIWTNPYDVGSNGQRVVSKRETELGVDPETGFYYITVTHPYRFLEPIYENDPTHPQASFFRSLGYPPLARLKYYPIPVPRYSDWWPLRPLGKCSSPEGRYCAKWFIQSVPATNDTRDMSFLDNGEYLPSQTITQKYHKAVRSRSSRLCYVNYLHIG